MWIEELRRMDLFSKPMLPDGEDAGDGNVSGEDEAEHGSNGAPGVQSDFSVQPKCASKVNDLLSVFGCMKR